MSEDRHDGHQRALLRLAREVTARHDLDDVLTEAFRELRTLVDFAGGSIQLIDDDGWISVAASDPPVPQDAIDARVPLGNSVAGRVVLTEQAVYVADVRADGRPVLLPTRDWANSVRCYLAVPLLVDGRAIGLLRIDEERPDAFTAADRQFMVAAGVMVAAAIQNARAQARVTSARQRVAALEQRLDELRLLVEQARAASALSDQEVTDLLARIEARAAVDPPTVAADGPRVTL
jgi:GAF domain-containing protein